MAQFTRLQVYQLLQDTGLMPLFYQPDPEKAFQVLAACYRGGVRAAEMTNRGDFAHEVFADVHKRVLRELPGMALGAGSIQDGGTASLYLQLGAAFIVTPVFRDDIALVCNRRKVAFLPGCTTLGEIARAEEWGCEIVKLFPGELMGPEFVRAVRGPQPWTSLMPTGGVEPTVESIQAWFEAGVSCVGMGSKLITRELMENEDYAALESKVRFLIDTIRILKMR